MARYGAEVGVAAGLQFGGLRFFAFGDRFEAGEFIAVLFDHNVVFERSGIFEVDRDYPGFGAEFRRIESQFGFAGFDVKGGAGATTCRFLASGGLAALVRRFFAGLVFRRPDRFFPFDRAFGFFFSLFFVFLGFAAEGATFVFVGTRGLASFDLFVD